MCSKVYRHDKNNSRNMQDAARTMFCRTLLLTCKHMNLYSTYTYIKSHPFRTPLSWKRTPFWLKLHCAFLFLCCCLWSLHDAVHHKKYTDTPIGSNVYMGPTHTLTRGGGGWGVILLLQLTQMCKCTHACADWSSSLHGAWGYSQKMSAIHAQVRPNALQHNFEKEYHLHELAWIHKINVATGY